MDAQRLSEIPLFAGLSRRDRKRVAEHADEVDVASGTTLIREGHLAYEFFAVIEGVADVLQGDQRIAALGPGEVFGEIGVLATHKRTATVVATSPMKLIVMYGPELTALSEKVPEVFEKLREIIREREPGSA